MQQQAGEQSSDWYVINQQNGIPVLVLKHYRARAAERAFFLIPLTPSQILPEERKGGD